MKQITGARHTNSSPSPNKFEEKNLILTKFVRTKTRIQRADFFPNYDSDEKVEMIAAQIMKETTKEELFQTPPPISDKNKSQSEKSQISSVGYVQT